MQTSKTIDDISDICFNCAKELGFKPKEKAVGVGGLANVQFVMKLSHVQMHTTIGIHQIANIKYSLTLTKMQLFDIISLKLYNFKWMK